MNLEIGVSSDERLCGSLIFAEAFNREHFKVMRLIEKYKERFLRLGNKNSDRLITRRVPVKKAGRPIDEYMLNEKQAIFLGTLFRNTDKVLDFKEKLANDFVEQKNILNNLSAQRQSSEWINNRASGKIARRDETDSIKDFVAYAKAQGSKNADHYYANLTACVNNSLFLFNGKFKNKREAMTAVQLMNVGFADNVVSKYLVEGMAHGLPYKEIYQLVKNKMLILADLHGKSEVIDRQLAIE